MTPPGNDVPVEWFHAEWVADSLLDEELIDPLPETVLRASREALALTIVLDRRSPEADGVGAYHGRTATLRHRVRTDMGWYTWCSRRLWELRDQRGHDLPLARAAWARLRTRTAITPEVTEVTDLEGPHDGRTTLAFPQELLQEFPQDFPPAVEFDSPWRTGLSAVRRALDVWLLAQTCAPFSIGAAVLLHNPAWPDVNPVGHISGALWEPSSLLRQGLDAPRVYEVELLNGLVVQVDGDSLVPLPEVLADFEGTGPW